MCIKTLKHWKLELYDHVILLCVSRDVCVEVGGGGGGGSNKLLYMVNADNTNKL